MNDTIIIRKQKFLIHANDAGDALQYRKIINDDWINGFTHHLHRELNGLHFPNPNVFIDKISVAISAEAFLENNEQLQRQIGEAILKQLMQKSGAAFMNDAEVKMNTVHESNEATETTASTENTKAFFHYLSQGYLPAWCRHVGFSPDAWLSNQLENYDNPPIINLLAKWLKANPQHKGTNTLKRLILLVKKEQQAKFYEAIFSEYEASYLPIHNYIDAIASELNLSTLALKAALLRVLFSEQKPWLTNWLFEIFLAVNKHSNFQNETDHFILEKILTAIKKIDTASESLFLKATKKAAKEIETIQGISSKKIVEQIPEMIEKDSPSADDFYTTQAGLILLHPFLPELFKSANLLDASQQFVNETAQKKGVLFLKYLSGKPLNDWELGFEKMLCGLAATVLVEVETNELSEAEKNTATELLQAVLNYWPPLKNSSISALQETFISRFGKYRNKDLNWMVNIERSGVDILLEQLPWSFTFIKLPWLQPLIEVIW